MFFVRLYSAINLLSAEPAIFLLVENYVLCQSQTIDYNFQIKRNSNR